MPLDEAECTQRIRASFVAEAISGAVQFSPKLLDFGTVLLGTEAAKELTLTNVSDCNLHYELEVVEDELVKGLDTDGDGCVEASCNRRSYCLVWPTPQASGTL